MDRQRGIGLSVSGTERSVSDDGGRHIVPRYGARVSRDLTAVTKQRPNDQVETARISCEPRKQLVSTQIQLSTGSASFLPPEALPRFAFRVNEDYMKKVDIIYEPREVAPRTHLHDVILSTLFSEIKNEIGFVLGHVVTVFLNHNPHSALSASSNDTTSE
ncbi:hypothetical protein ALC53_04725 [Atta colombica]|uniref:Uncharacterized protein n=1 Tax=Atta colombica TaxID=520822 RepID=A0A195BLC7_9HYME|nr:hypothetical protein ALC53_04725 [Atta colombica]